MASLMSLQISPHNKCFNLKSTCFILTKCCGTTGLKFQTPGSVSGEQQIQSIMCTLHLEEEQVTVIQEACTCYTQEECAAAFPDAPDADADASNADAPNADASNANNDSSDSNTGSDESGNADQSDADSNSGPVGDRGLGK